MGSHLSALYRSRSNMWRLLTCFFLLSQVLYPADGHGWFRGYKNTRTWGTGPQRKTRIFPIRNRVGKQASDEDTAAAAGGACSECDDSTMPGTVCGTDGKTYNNRCQLYRVACTMERRQGRSFSSPQLSLSVSHPGPCKNPCAGMEELGHYQAFNTKATNNGLCIHDFFTCAGKMRG